MAENTNIEWAHHTLNGWIGCQKVGPGCDHCYAEIWDGRSDGTRWGPHAIRTRTKEKTWNQPLRWNRLALEAGERHRVFASSLADVFDNHASVDPAWRRDLGALILKTPQLDWLLLTKRIGNASAMLADMFPQGVPSNLWLGATVVTQKEAERDIPVLLKTKAKHRISAVFLSMEPLLEHVRISPWMSRDGQGVDWVICGAESGPSARSMESQWASSLKRECEKFGTAFFMKQMSGKGGNVLKDMSSFPEDLRVQEFPYG